MLKLRKVIFLDIDGVLNAHEGIATIRRDCCERLNRIIAATGARVVLSSAWRYMVLDTGDWKAAMTCVGFSYMLKTHGVECEIIGTTCSDEECSPRGQQIRKWMRDHFRPECWIVIDDGGVEEYGFEILGEWLIQTNSEKGLEDHHVDIAIAALNRKDTP